MFLSALSFYWQKNYDEIVHQLSRLKSFFQRFRSSRPSSFANAPISVITPINHSKKYRQYLLLGLGLIAIASGLVAALLLSSQSQDVRQQASGGWCTGQADCPAGWTWGGGEDFCSAGLKYCSQGASSGGGTSNPGTTTPTTTAGTCASGWTCNGNCADQAAETIFTNTWCNPKERWLWEAAGNTASCGGNESALKSTGCGSAPAGTGGGTIANATTTCSPNAPTATACRNGNAINSSCTGFSGICQATSSVDQATGQKHCACVPVSNSLTKGQQCAENAQCLTGYCGTANASGVRVCADAPAAGTGGTTTTFTCTGSGNSCANNASECIQNGGRPNTALTCSGGKTCCSTPTTTPQCTVAGQKLDQGQSVCGENNTVVLTCANASANTLSRTACTTAQTCLNGKCVAVNTTTPPKNPPTTTTDVIKAADCACSAVANTVTGCSSGQGYGVNTSDCASGFRCGTQRNCGYQVAPNQPTAPLQPNCSSENQTCSINGNAAGGYCQTVATGQLQFLFGGDSRYDCQPKKTSGTCSNSNQCVSGICRNGQCSNSAGETIPTITQAIPANTGSASCTANYQLCNTASGGGYCLRDSGAGIFGGFNCTPKEANGSVCSNANECQSNSCENGLCRPTTNTTLKATTCTINGRTVNFNQSFCQNNQVVRADASCRVSLLQNCANGQSCVNGTCTVITTNPSLPTNTTIPDGTRCVMGRCLCTTGADSGRYITQGEICGSSSQQTRPIRTCYRVVTTNSSESCVSYQTTSSTCTGDRVFADEATCRNNLRPTCYKIMTEDTYSYCTSAVSNSSVCNGQYRFTTPTECSAAIRAQYQGPAVQAQCPANSTRLTSGVDQGQCRCFGGQIISPGQSCPTMPCTNTQRYVCQRLRNLSQCYQTGSGFSDYVCTGQAADQVISLAPRCTSTNMVACIRFGGCLPTSEGGVCRGEMVDCYTVANSCQPTRMRRNECEPTTGSPTARPEQYFSQDACQARYNEINSTCFELIAYGVNGNLDYNCEEIRVEVGTCGNTNNQFRSRNECVAAGELGIERGYEAAICHEVIQRNGVFSCEANTFLRYECNDSTGPFSSEQACNAQITLLNTPRTALPTATQVSPRQQAINACKAQCRTNSSANQVGFLTACDAACELQPSP